MWRQRSRRGNERTASVASRLSLDNKRPGRINDMRCSSISSSLSLYKISVP